MPTISVIVPVYNVEKYLHCCVDSILAQTFTDIEVLLVDDGSTDGSGIICDEYAQKDSRVRVFHKMNGGVSSARNLGLDEATGKWIMFVDSDDKVASMICEQLLHYADEGILSTCPLGKWVENESELTGFKEVSSSTYAIDKFDKVPAPGPVAKLYERSIIGNNLRFNTNFSFAEDAIFNYQYYQKIKGFTIVQSKMYFYRILPLSLSHGRYIPNFPDIITELYTERVKLGKKLKLTENEIYDQAYYRNLFYSLCAVMNNNMHKNAPGRWSEKIKFNSKVLKNEEFLKSVKYIDFIGTNDFTRRYLITMKIACYTGNYFWLWLLGIPGKIKSLVLGKS